MVRLLRAGRLLISIPEIYILMSLGRDLGTDSPLLHLLFHSGIGDGGCEAFCGFAKEWIGLSVETHRLRICDASFGHHSLGNHSG